MKTKITFIADTHYFSPTLTDGGRAYELRSGSDQKCLLETGALVDSAFDMLSKSDTEAVIIAGDVTDNGERASHNEFREKLYALKNKKPVYLITATHDWCSDGRPHSYFGDEVKNDAPYMNADELRDFYFDFGPKQAKSEFITPEGVCSYTVDIGDEVRLLAINDDRNGNGRAGYLGEHLDWILGEIKKAKDEGKFLIGMEHHLIMPHIHPLISAFGMQIGDSEKTATILADAGLRYMFVGHSHIQRTSTLTTEKGNTITQINVGSLVGYPGSIVNVTVENGKLDYEINHTDTFTYNSKTENTMEYLANHALGMIDNVLNAAAGKDKKEFVDRLGALGIKSEKINKLHPIIRPFAKKLMKMKVSNLYHIINPITLGKLIDKKDAKEYWNTPVMDFVHEIFLSVFGSELASPKDEAYCNLVKGVVSLPAFYVRKNKVLKQLPQVIECLISA